MLMGGCPIGVAAKKKYRLVKFIGMISVSYHDFREDRKSCENDRKGQKLPKLFLGMNVS